MATIYGIADSTITQGFAPSSFNYSRFGITRNGGYFHNGVDLAGPAGTPIYAWEDGSVYQGYESGGWGNFVIFSARGWQIPLAHLSRYGKGGAVKKGDIIGYRGTTGNSTGNHTHVEAHPPNQNRNNGVLGAVDPNEYFATLGVQSNQMADDALLYTENDAEMLYLYDIGRVPSRDERRQRLGEPWGKAFDAIVKSPEANTSWSQFVIDGYQGYLFRSPSQKELGERVNALRDRKYTPKQFIAELKASQEHKDRLKEYNITVK